MSTLARTTKPDYPPAPTDDTVDVYHGVSVPDPYRPLEDMYSDETKAWVAAQNELTFGYLDTIPGRDALLARLLEVNRYETTGVPYKVGGRYFFSRSDGIRNQPVLYVTDDLDGEARVLLDPNTWSEDGTVALTSYNISRDGEWILYGKSKSGSDWTTIEVMGIATGGVLPDRLDWIKGWCFFNADASGIYYIRWPQPDPGEVFSCKMENPVACFHRLGTPAGADYELLSLPDHPDRMISFRPNEDRDLLVFTVTEHGSRHNRLYFKDLGAPDSPVERVLDLNDAVYEFITNQERHVLVRTTLDAPNSRVVEIDLDNPGPEHWREVIPECSLTLQEVSSTGGYLFAHYLKDAHHEIHRYRPDGTPAGTVKLPGHGLVMGFGGFRQDTEVCYGYQDMTTPLTIYRFDIATGESELKYSCDLKLDTSNYVMRQQFYRAPDGTAIPIFLLHKEGIELDGSHPTILYAYGGFGLPQLPYFDVKRCVWLEAGGIYAVACIRGGSEYGDAWHEAAIKTKRHVAFDDFIAGAEYLIKQGYTSRERLAVHGRSNGGLLIGAVVNKRPDLFAAASPWVGVLDLVRNNRWGFGPTWERDYGSPEVAEEFAALLKYSPYHNLKEGERYPAILVQTGDTDDRVIPAHSYKYTARLQECQAEDGPPVMLRVDTDAGHGMGKPLDKLLRELADMYAFMLHNMGAEIPAGISEA